MKESEHVPQHIMVLRLLADSSKPSPACSVPDALEFRREQYGLTKSQFAAILGMAYNRYTEILTGKRMLSLVQIKRAYAIGVPADVLLAITGEGE